MAQLVHKVVQRSSYNLWGEPSSQCLKEQPLVLLFSDSVVECLGWVGLLVQLVGVVSSGITGHMQSTTLLEPWPTSLIWLM